MNNKVRKLLSKVVAGEKYAYQNLKKSQKHGEISCSLLEMINFFAEADNLRDCDPEALCVATSWFVAMYGGKRPLKFIELILDSVSHKNWGAFVSVVFLHTMLGFKETYDADSVILKAIHEAAELNKEQEPWAQFILGLIYIRGIGIQKDVVLGKSYFVKAISLPCGIIHTYYASCLLPELNNSSQRSEQDISQISLLVETAKQLNYASAFIFEAACYYQGSAWVAKDLTKVEQIALEGIKLGHPEGYDILARMHKDAKTADSNKIKELEEKAVEGGVRAATIRSIDSKNRENINLSNAFSNIKNSFCHLLTTLNDEAYELSEEARDLLLDIFAGKGDYNKFKRLQVENKIVCTQNDMLMFAAIQEDLSLCIAEVFYDLAICYLSQNSWIRPKIFVNTILSAAEKSNPGAKLALVFLFQDGSCEIPKNVIQSIYDESLHLILKEDIYAMLTVGLICHHNLLGNVTGSNKGVELLISAARYGNPIAQLVVASLNFNSNVEAALAWLQNSAMQLLPHAFTLLGIAHMRGLPKQDSDYSRKSFVVGSLLGSNDSFTNVYQLMCDAKNDFFETLCFNVESKLNPNLCIDFKPSFSIAKKNEIRLKELNKIKQDILAVESNANLDKDKLYFSNFKASEIHNTIKDHLVNILAGKPGAYRIFKESKSKRKFIFSLTEQLYFFSSQESLATLDYEAFFDCAHWYIEMESSLRPVKFIVLTYEAVFKNNLGACFALMLFENKKLISISKNVKDVISQFLIGIAYNNAENMSWALAALGMIKMNEQRLKKEQPKYMTDYIERAIEMLNPAIVYSFANTMYIRNGDISKTIRYLKLSCLEFSSFAKYTLGRIYSTKRYEYFNLDRAFKYFEKSALQGYPPGMAAYALLCEQISKEDKRIAFYLKQAKKYGGEHSIRVISELLGQKDNQDIKFKVHPINFNNRLLSSIREGNLYLTSTLATEDIYHHMRISENMWNKITYSVRNCEYLKSIYIEGFTKNFEFDYQNLIASLKKLKQLDTLIIKNMRINLINLEKLLLFARKTNLKNLEINQVKITYKEYLNKSEALTSKLVDFFEKTTLESFKLTMDNDQFYNFIHALKNSTIRDINISNCALTGQDINYLQEVVINPAIEILSLADEYAGIDREDFKLLISAIKANKNIRGLDISGLCSKTNSSFKPKEGEYGKIISQLIVELEGLNYLVMEDNNISDTDLKVLSEVLKINQSVVYLDMSCNEIDDDGMIYLSEALKINTMLKELILGINNFGDLGLQALFESITANSANILTSLTIGLPSYPAKITQKSMKSLIQFIQHPNCRLEFLNLSCWGGQDSKLTEADFILLFEALTKNYCLTQLKLCDTPIGEKSKQSILRLLKKNLRINIDLNNTNLTSESILEINHKIKENLKSSASNDGKKSSQKVSKISKTPNKIYNKEQIKKDFLFIFQNANVPVKIQESDNDLKIIFATKEYFLQCISFLKDKLGESNIDYNENESFIVVKNYLNYDKKCLASLPFLLWNLLSQFQSIEKDTIIVGKSLNKSEQTPVPSTPESFSAEEISTKAKAIKLLRKEKLDKFELVNQARKLRKEIRDQERQLKLTRKKTSNPKTIFSHGNLKQESASIDNNNYIESESKGEIKEIEPRIEIIINNPNALDEKIFPLLFSEQEENKDKLIKLAIDNGHCLLGMFDAVKKDDYHYNSPVMIYEGLYCSMRMLQSLSLSKSSTELLPLVSQSDAQDFRHILIDRCDYFLMALGYSEHKLLPFFSENNESLITILSYSLLPQIEKIYEKENFNPLFVPLSDHILFKTFCLNKANAPHPTILIPFSFIKTSSECFRVINTQVERINNFLHGIKSDQEINTQVHELNAIRMAVVFIGNLARILRDTHHIFDDNGTGKFYKYSENVHSFVKSYGQYSTFRHDINNPKKIPLLLQLKFLTSNNKSIRSKIKHLMEKMSLFDVLILFIEIRNTIGHDYKGSQDTVIEYVYEEISGHLLYDIVNCWVENEEQQQYLKELENKETKTTPIAPHIIKNSEIFSEQNQSDTSGKNELELQTSKRP